MEQINKQVILNAEPGILEIGNFIENDVVFDYVISKLANGKWIVNYVTENPPMEDLDHLTPFQIRYFGTRATQEFIESFMQKMIPIHQDAWELYQTEDEN